MRALILNSGMGKRMGALTKEHPKCMTEISEKDTILSRQLKLIADAGIKDVVMTTGYFDKILIDYCNSLNLPLNYTFVNNPEYDKTNYIYSIYVAREHLDDDIVMMHGDLVFEEPVFNKVVTSLESCMTVSSTLPLPEKDFKAVINGDKIEKVGIEFFDNAMAAQPLYKLCKKDWKVWLDSICEFCESDNRKVYAENAFNEVSDRCNILPFDVKNALCGEIDTPEDLAVISSKIAELENRTVYMCFTADMINKGHLSVIKKAAKRGKLIIGVLDDETEADAMPYSVKCELFKNMKGVYKVVKQEKGGFVDAVNALRPDFVFHSDSWCNKSVRDETASVLAQYGGQLVEYKI